MFNIGDRVYVQYIDHVYSLFIHHLNLSSEQEKICKLSMSYVRFKYDKKIEKQHGNPDIILVDCVGKIIDTTYLCIAGEFFDTMCAVLVSGDIYVTSCRHLLKIER